jgi:REP element-mobilizing transposase RayT
MDNDNAGKFKNKYRIATARWAAWDYGRNAAYFVTICVADRADLFGAVVNGQMRLTPLGQSAEDCWRAIPDHFPFVELDAFVVMPNHMHGIVVINKPDTVQTQGVASLPPPDMAPAVQTQNFASLPPPDMVPAVQTQDLASLPPTAQNKFGPQSKNLASIIRGYKIGVTKFARQNGLPFAWQPRYHDHVIRNGDDLARIQKYITDNPRQWEQDRFFLPIAKQGSA